MKEQLVRAKEEEEERKKQEALIRQQMVQDHNNRIHDIQLQMMNLQQVSNDKQLDEAKLQKHLQRVQEERQIVLDQQ